MIDRNEKAVLHLIGRALFGHAVTLDSDTDLNAVLREAKDQSMLATVYCSLTEEELSRISPADQQKWRMTFFRFVAKSQQLLYEQANVISLLEKNGTRFALLKGSSCAANYPDPSLRAMGDVDILVAPDEQRAVVELLQADGYSEVVEEDHHCHLTVRKGRVSVEVHREPNGLFINEDDALRERIDAFFADALDRVQMENGYPALSDRHQAVVLVLHKLEHFLAGGLGLRQLCDWAMFVQKRMTAELWGELEPLLESFGLLTFTLMVTRACIDHLGLPAEDAPWAAMADKELSDKVMEHIIRSGNFGVKDKAYGERFFVDAHSKGRISSAFKVVGSACRTHWPVCARHPILMPVAPFVVYARYLKLRREGKRDKFRPVQLYQRAGSRQQLYRDLKPFVADQTKEN